jgi:hypothetical protein
MLQYWKKYLLLKFEWKKWVDWGYLEQRDDSEDLFQAYFEQADEFSTKTDFEEEEWVNVVLRSSLL